MNTNPWKYVEIDESELMTNPYLHPPTLPTPSPRPASDPIPAVHFVGDSIVLEDIACFDADGNIFENYQKLAVQKDIFRNPQGRQIILTPYLGAVHCEKNGLFLPSFALSCAIVARLYQTAVRKEPTGYTTLDAEVEKVLYQYKDKGNGTGWHTQNTVINWGAQQIIHYPQDGDFPVHGGNNNINQSQLQKKLAFDRTGFSDNTLVDALQKPNFNKYLRNLTGLKSPSILVDISAYFGKTARVWISSSNDTRAAWFGCYSNNLNLNGNSNLDNNSAGRGVRRGAP